MQSLPNRQIVCFVHPTSLPQWKWDPCGVGILSGQRQTLAMYSGLPPSRMSVPRPAMLVEMVTAPLRPLCATISDSRSTFSGLAFSSS